MSGEPEDQGGWTPWCVAPRSGFETLDPDGKVGLVQTDVKTFLVETPFRFSDSAIEKQLIGRMVEDGTPEEIARQQVDDARTFRTIENPTDLASIPPFMRWFENSYGAHTLAAILHDELIVDEPDGGALGSDTMADSFFREMMRTAGVPWLKRWIMWTAVAVRSRWAAGGARRILLAIWIVLALAGIAAFVDAVGALVWDWPHPFDAGLMIAIAVVLPFASAPLWGKQYGASLVAAIAALWILPAAVIALFAYLVYSVLEGLARRVGWT